MVVNIDYYATSTGRVISFGALLLARLLFRQGAGHLKILSAALKRREMIFRFFLARAAEKEIVTLF